MTIAVFSLFFGLARAFAGEPPPAPVGPSASEKAEILERIEKLSSTDFDERNQASLELARYEGKAYRLLLEAEETTNDAETRHRCDFLIPAAHSANFEDRIEAFLADRKGEYSHDLPGLHTFLKRTQGTPAAREFLTKMLSVPEFRKLLLIAESDPESLSHMVRNLATEFRKGRTPKLPKPPPGLLVNPPVLNPADRVATPATPAEMLGLFYLDSLTKGATERSPQASASLTPFLYQTTFRKQLIRNVPGSTPEALTDENALVARTIVKGWFETREDSDELNIAVSYSMQFDMPEVTVRCAMRQLTRKNLRMIYRGIAICSLGRNVNDPRALEQLNQLLKDHTPAGSRVERDFDEDGKAISRTITIQSRDIAFAMILRGKDLKPSDYGMSVYSNSKTSWYQSANHWFKSDADRTAAFEKFEREKKTSKSIEPEK